MSKVNMYDEITNTIITQLESVNPKDWQKPWFNIGIAPQNAITRKAYRGVNHVLLGFKPYTSKSYASYKQWQEKGCNVNKGEKGHRIVFWSFTENEDTGEKYAFLRHYTVFNSEQVTGDYARQCETLPDTARLNPHQAIERAECFLKSYLANEHIRTKEDDRAYYNTVSDLIAMPQLGQFNNPVSYYSTFLHEAIHSTGHNKRLNRDLTGQFGSKDYAKEELIAELGAAMLCGSLAITASPRLDHAQYIAGLAQKACDYITEKSQGLTVDKTETLAA